MKVDVSTVDWKSAAASLKLSGAALIGGKTADAISGEVLDAINPANGSILTRVASCDAADVDIAVRSGRQAFENGSWSGRAPAERKNVLRRLAELMLANADELALLETLSVGKPIRDTRNIDVPASANTIAWYAEAIDKIYDEVAPAGEGALGLVTREPVGLVGAVVSWDFPLVMACWKLGPALAAGNSVVLKPSELSALSALRLGQLALEAGLPEGVLNVVPGRGSSAGKALGLHRDVDVVSVAGSPETGRTFLSYAAQSNMKRVALGCGGKTPHIVMADSTHLDDAATAAASGVFWNQGALCDAGSRLLVDEAIKEEFVAKVIAIAKDLRPGDPLDPTTRLGAIVSKAQAERILDYITIGRQEEAELKVGGRRVLAETGGFYIEPTIFDKVRNDMRIAREEIFGPVLSIITFRGAEEAIRIANDTQFGLAAAVWTDNVDVAISAARRLKAGTVWVNNFDESNMGAPYGGVKQSGFGRDKSLYALEQYTSLKSTWIKVRN